ncbi:Haloacid dehalogenase-like hydrolase (HAD) superfamily protein [Rhynchospora pubera]|uniref:Haloacid dehalogenase-like hydrolase (HAD) superfamily protein n=1 Tax=Rhynchospora pubera TaxID=906938 RepID=A0AAV8FTS0_9POAL|nr:Haloacid dehalogenase-like hydrolase (HAD) superfamily protein [Rhynchospora pubera]
MVSLIRPAPFFFSPLSKRTSRPCIAMAASSAATHLSQSQQRRLPVLLFDVMDTIVRDPFYHHIPTFFQMSMKELLETKHPTAWVEFEEGLIDENELAKKFFKDGRSFDLEGLKECMVRAYSYIDGIEDVLLGLKENNYEIHAFTNYPVWYMLIEEKLKLSKYLSWSFCSCRIGKRKPSPDSYNEVVNQLGVEPSNCVFVDDRMTNIEAAINIGMVGLQFKNAELLKEDLSSLGIEVKMPLDIS